MTPPPTILIIDDEISLRLTLAQILQRAGYAVDTAGSGKEGITLLSKNDYRLLFLDLKMPGEDGIELVPVIRNLQPELPIFILTAYPSMNTAVPAIEYGVTDYLTKPVDPRRILQKVSGIFPPNGSESRQAQVLVHDDAPAELESADPVWVDRDTRAEVVYTIQAPGVLICGGLSADIFTRTVMVGKRVRRLSKTAFWYLAVLIRWHPEPVPFTTLVGEAEGKLAALDEAVEIARNRIREIRKQLDSPGTRRSIIRLCPEKGYFLAVRA